MKNMQQEAAHEHVTAPRYSQAAKRLSLSLLITAALFIIEVAGGLMSNSLALLSDAGHVLTDAFAIGLSLLALYVMRRPSDFRATFGYQRIGILAALINGVGLVVISLFIFIEAYHRLVSPPLIDTTLMLSVAAIGFLGNLIMVFIIGSGHGDLNLKSAWLHIIGDTLSSAGVIVAGVVIHVTGWREADTVASAVVGTIIIVSGIKVIRDSLWIFLELSPVHLHSGELAREIRSVSGVKSVHDVHIWSIGQGIPAFSGHILVDDQMMSDADTIRREIEGRLASYGIRHSVLQVESSGCDHREIHCRREAPTRDDH